jgi:Ca-activated chloride channel family protein
MGSPMTFIWPVMLLSLFLIPLFAVLYLRLQRRRRRFIASYGNLGFVQAASGRGLGLRRHVPPALFLFSLAVLFVGLARPQTMVSLPDDMNPSRIEAAKAAARDFVQRQPPSVQIGVVAFSDNGFSMQVPTNDQDTILAAINRLMPERGTSVAHGIEASLNAIAAASGQPPHLSTNIAPAPTPSPTPVPQGTYTPAAIVLLSDGENNESPDPMAAAQAAADRGVRIYTVGIGSAAGTTLHINGFTVFTQLDEQALQQIAKATGGTYYNATTAQDLREIYDNLNPQLVIKPQKLEVTSIFAGVSILTLVIGGVFSLLWFTRLP